MPHRRRRSRLTFFGAGAAIVVTVLIAWIDSRAAESITAAIQDVTYTLEVEHAFLDLEKNLGDAETSQRGFLLTGDDSYLVPFQGATRNLDSRSARLSALTASSASQSARIIELQTLAGQKFAEMQQTIALAQRGDRDAALDVINSGRGRNLMDGIRRIVQAGIAEEVNAFNQRVEILASQRWWRSALTWSLVLINASVLAALVVTLRRIQRLEPMVTMCAWSRTIKFDNEWVSFEQYLWRKFGIATTHGLSPDHQAILLAQVQREAAGTPESDPA